MKVSILSNGKITTTQYNNVSVDGKVEVMGGSGIEVETDPIFKDWRTSTGDKLVTDVASVQSEVSTLSEEVATVASELEGKADKDEIPEMPDLSGYATTDSVAAGLATKANNSDVYTKEQVYTKTEVNEALDDKADKTMVNANTTCITALNNSVNSLNESIIVLGSDKADKAAVDVNTACITALNSCITTLGCDLSSLDSTVSALSTTVTNLGCSLNNKISYSDLSFCSAGYGCNYITAHGITTGQLIPDSCDGIHIPDIIANNIKSNSCIFYLCNREALDIVACASEIWMDGRYTAIRHMCNVTIDSPSFKVQYNCDSPISINYGCNSFRMCIGINYISAYFYDGYVHLVNTANNTYVEVLVDDRGFGLYADVYGDGCNRDHYSITRWIEAPDNGGGYIPVFSAGS